MSQTLYTLGILLGMAGCWALDRNQLQRQEPKAAWAFWGILGTAGLLSILRVWGIHPPPLPDILGYLFGRIRL